MALKDDLKLYLPESQRGNPSLDQFLDSVGELLDGFKAAINDIQKNSDFEEISETLLEELGKEFNVTFPRNMSIERKRKYLREAITLYRSGGTKRSFKRIFRFVGWNVEIDEYYVLNPQWFSNPSDTYTLTNEQGNTYTFGLYDKLIGEKLTYVGDEVYVDIKDPLGNIYPKKKIYGQSYSVIETDSFVKVPYIRINVTSEDYNVFTSDYIVDGNVYSYDQSEEFEILENIRNYFINRDRPTTIAIIEISTPFGLTDTITYSLVESGVNQITGTPTFTFSSSTNTLTRDTGSWLTDGYYDEMLVSITGTTSNDGVYKIKSVTDTTITMYSEYSFVDETISGIFVVLQEPNVATYPTVAKYDGTMSYGTTTDRYILGESFGGLKYGSNDMDYYGVKNKAPNQTITRTYTPQTSGAQNRIGVRKKTNVTLTVPSDATVTLYASKSYRYDIASGNGIWVPIASNITNVTGSVYSLEGYFSVYLDIITPSTSSNIDMTVDLLS